jgi:hypothetical protein
MNAANARCDDGRLRCLIRERDADAIVALLEPMCAGIASGLTI